MKKIISILLVLLTLLGSVGFAAAAELHNEAYRIMDYAGVLSDDWEYAEEDLIAEAIEKYDLDFVYLTVENTGDKTLADYAKDYYTDNQYGVGDDNSGAIFAYDWDTGKVGIYTFGQAQTLYSSQQLDDVLTAVLEPMNAGEDEKACETFFREMYLVIDPTGSIGHAVTDPDFEGFHDADAPRVVDDADLFTPDEEVALNNMISGFQTEHNADFVVVTVNDTDGKSHMDFADDYFDYNGYGLGDNYDGLLFLICMNPDHRGYYLSTCGDTIFWYNDATVDRILDNAYDYLVDGDYAGAASSAIYDAGYYIDNNVRGYDEPAPPKEPLTAGETAATVGGCGIFSFLISNLIGKGHTSSLVKKMKTVRTATDARNYTESFDLTQQSDDFLFANVVRTEIPKSSSSSGGGGGGHSYHSSSSGRSHGGGGRSF